MKVNHCAHLELGRPWISRGFSICRLRLKKKKILKFANVKLCSHQLASQF